MSPAMTLRILAVAAFSDGVLHDSEKSFLKRFQEVNGLALESLQEALDRAREKESLKLVRPSSPEERREVFREAAAIVAVDGGVVPAEHAFMERLGNALGIDAVERTNIVMGVARVYRAHPTASSPEQKKARVAQLARATVILMVSGWAVLFLGSVALGFPKERAAKVGLLMSGFIGLMGLMTMFLGSKDKRPGR